MLQKLCLAKMIQSKIKFKKKAKKLNTRDKKERKVVMKTTYNIINTK